MQRRQFCLHLLGSAGLLITTRIRAHSDDVERIKLSEEQWQERLSERQFDILRMGDTESAGSSPLNAETRTGVYHCAGCDLPIFHSQWKYESGTGWPSFWDVIPDHVDRQSNFPAFFRAGIEYHCAQCGGHQGHIFEDGPEPTGLRYCNNGIALEFKPA